MKKFQSLGKSLSKNEMKNVLGGVVAPGGGCQWTYSGCDYNESGILECDYIDCNGVAHCGFQCMYPGDGSACAS